MAKKTRVTRKELLKEPDEFLTFSARAIAFAAKNKKPLTYGLLGLLFIVFAFSAFSYYSTVNERRAYGVFQQGLSELKTANGKESSGAALEKAKGSFDEVLNRYSSTEAANLSLLLSADASYRQGAYDQAIALYERALDEFPRDSVWQRLIWNDLAYCYDAKKDYPKAAEYFRRVTQSDGDFLKGDAYFALGRVLEASGSVQEAVSAYEQVANKYPQSVNAFLAEEKLATLQKSIVSPPSPASPPSPEAESKQEG